MYTYMYMCLFLCAGHCKMRAQILKALANAPTHSAPPIPSLFANDPHFSIPIALSDLTGGLEGVRLAEKAYCANKYTYFTYDNLIDSSSNTRCSVLMLNVYT